MRSFWFSVCPLCQHAVENDCPTCYHVVPSSFSPDRLHCPNLWTLACARSVLINLATPRFMFNPYKQNMFRRRRSSIHLRCREIVRHLSDGQIPLLVDLVEPTFFPHTLHKEIPRNVHGAFSSEDLTLPPRQWPLSLLQQLPVEIQDMVLERDIGRMLFVLRTASHIAKLAADRSAVPKVRIQQWMVTMRSHKMLRIHLADVGGRRYISGLLPLPGAWDELVFSKFRDAWRTLRFVTWKQPVVSLMIALALMLWSTIPFEKFTMDPIRGLEPYVQVIYYFERSPFWIRWMVYLGAGVCSLIANVISLAWMDAAMRWSRRPWFRDYNLGDSDYLAVKTDGMGVIDIAFHQTGSGAPNWILAHSAHPFLAEISVTRCANLQKLCILGDTQKCRAIFPLNRDGPEPYFPTSNPSPPANAFIDAGFSPDSLIRNYFDPLGAIARATYAPFATLRNIELEFDEHGLGLVGLKMNQKPEELKGKYVVVFECPPVKMSVRVVTFMCRVRHCRGLTKVMFVQFQTRDEQWKPPLSDLRPIGTPETIQIDNVVGIWWSEMVRHVPVYFGTVVADKKDLRKVKAPYRKVGEWEWLRGDLLD